MIAAAIVSVLAATAAEGFEPKAETKQALRMLRNGDAEAGRAATAVTARVEHRIAEAPRPSVRAPEIDKPNDR